MIDIYWDCGEPMPESTFQSFIARGYWFANYKPGRITLFAPCPYGGSVGYVTGERANELGRIHDAWNYGIYERRARENPKL